MKETKQLKKKHFKISGGIFGLIACVIAFFAYGCSIYLFPGGYSFFENMISELGSAPHGIIFNLGLIFSGIVSIPFYFSLYKSFDGENINPILKKAAIIFSLISIITFIFVGVFPSIEEDELIFLIHGTFAFFSFLTGLCYFISFSLLMLKDVKYSKLQAFHGFVVAGIYVIFLMTWKPIIEWMATFALISWIIINSYFLIHLKI